MEYSVEQLEQVWELDAVLWKLVFVTCCYDMSLDINGVEWFTLWGCCDIVYEIYLIQTN